MVAWKLGRRQGACAKCERAFAEGEVHFSWLYVEGGELGRRDVCPACWESVELGPEEPWWRARRREKKAGGVQVDLAMLEQLFLMSATAEAERLLELRYLIALLLLRKRRLLLGRLRREGGAEWLVLRRPRRDEELPVRVFEFAPERMDALRRDLERLLELGSLDDLAAEEPAADADDGTADDGAADDGGADDGAADDGADDADDGGEDATADDPAAAHVGSPADGGDGAAAGSGERAGWRRNSR